jgi:hypothetical protein
MVVPHQGDVRLKHSFNEVWTFIKTQGEIKLNTEREKTPFEVRADITTTGDHRGERVIVFTRGGEERARSYRCCWGHYNNCNRTRIGMYCKATDSFIP